MKELEKNEEKKVKTRRSEFLERYPNAYVLGIQPCVIEGRNFSEKHCSEHNVCSECVDAYWTQEVK